MTNAAHQMWQNGSLRSRLQQAGPDLALGLVSLTGVSIATSRLFGLTVSYFAQVTAAYLVLACLLVWYLPKNQPHTGLGAANRVTLFRATLILPLSALAGQPDPSIVRFGLPDHTQTSCRDPGFISAVTSTTHWME